METDNSLLHRRGLRETIVKHKKGRLIGSKETWNLEVINLKNIIREGLKQISGIFHRGGERGGRISQCLKGIQDKNYLYWLSINKWGNLLQLKLEQGNTWSFC